MHTVSSAFLYWSAQTENALELLGVLSADSMQCASETKYTVNVLESLGVLSVHSMQLLLDLTA